ncbi:hypothetical protein KL950_005384 [Ogataea haglerorum]|nr:hypothetical protein KL915_005369 [Ogataea haglerorum]KAG7702145.1 hypothetical protein KL950_005384 [Ogataea haglerorum]
MQNLVNSPKAKGSQSILMSRSQAANVIQTRRYFSSYKSNKMEPQDVTASDSSGHGVLNSIDISDVDSIINIEKSNRDITPIRKSESVDNKFSDFIKNRVSNNDGNQKYHKLYRILSDKHFINLCYSKVKSKQGNMTKGSTNETLDGFSFKTISRLSEQLEKGKFTFKPVRRVNIPKPGKTGTRPLGVGSPIEKIIQVGMAEILNYIYEPIFLDCSHGFRPKRSVKTALAEIHLHGGPYV